jgi:CHAT domain-containing protein
MASLGAHGKASALREAQLKLLDDPETAHPLFWAPFVLVGDGG